MKSRHHFQKLHSNITNMKHSRSTQHLQKFVYVDSSEEEEPMPDSDPRNPPKITRECNKQVLNFHDPSFNCQLKQIVLDQVDRIEHGQNLIVPVGESEMEQALYRRQQKYRWFLKEMQIDKKYHNIMGKKVQKLKEKNRQKEHVLAKKRLEEKYRSEEDRLKKLVIEKEGKQQQVLSNLHKMTHKLGMQRNNQIKKRLKSAVEAQRQKTGDQLATLQARQRNELQQLKNRYKEMKQSERLNKMQQAKVIRDLQQKNQGLRKQVEEKLVRKKEFVV